MMRIAKTETAHRSGRHSYSRGERSPTGHHDPFKDAGGRRRSIRLKAGIGLPGSLLPALPLRQERGFQPQPETRNQPGERQIEEFRQC